MLITGALTLTLLRNSNIQQLYSGMHTKPQRIQQRHRLTRHKPLLSVCMLNKKLLTGQFLLCNNALNFHTTQPKGTAG